MPWWTSTGMSSVFDRITAAPVSGHTLKRRRPSTLARIPARRSMSIACACSRPFDGIAMRSVSAPSIYELPRLAFSARPLVPKRFCSVS